MLQDEKNKVCAVIDPGFEPQTILDRVAKLGLTVDAVLLTHGHFDHVGAVRDLVALTDCHVYLHPADTAMPPQMTAGPLYYTHSLQGNETLSLCGMEIGVFHTPGHTPGCICLYNEAEKRMLTGDTLFADGGFGRFDFKYGDKSILGHSLHRLFEMDGDIAIYPGHGRASTLRDEHRTLYYFEYR